jgi:hypothetical protein
MLEQKVKTGHGHFFSRRTISHLLFTIIPNSTLSVENTAKQAPAQLGPQLGTFNSYSQNILKY